MTTIGWAAKREFYSIQQSVEICIPNLNKEKLKNWALPVTWRESFYKVLNEVVEIKSAWQFKDKGINQFYVAIAEPTTENILKLSEVYCDFLVRKIEENDNFYFDFLVLGETEIDNLNIPQTVYKIINN